MEGEGGSGCERDGRRDVKENGERWKEGSLVERVNQESLVQRCSRKSCVYSITYGHLST